MRSYPNIEKSAFRKGEYIGYGNGTFYRIRDYGKGPSRWTASSGIPGVTPEWFACDSLKKVSEKLESLGV